MLGDAAAAHGGGIGRAAGGRDHLRQVRRAERQGENEGACSAEEEARSHEWGDGGRRADGRPGEYPETPPMARPNMPRPGPLYNTRLRHPIRGGGGVPRWPARPSLEPVRA